MVSTWRWRQPNTWCCIPSVVTKAAMWEDDPIWIVRTQVRWEECPCVYRGVATMAWLPMLDSEWGKEYALRGVLWGYVGIQLCEKSGLAWGKLKANWSGDVRFQLGSMYSGYSALLFNIKSIKELFENEQTYTRSWRFSEAGMLKEESSRMHQGVMNANFSCGASSSPGGEWDHRQTLRLSVILR